MAQTPTTTDGLSEHTTRPAEPAAGWPDEKTDAEPTGKWDRLALYANSAFDKALNVLSKVPVAGKFCELILETKEAIEGLGDTIDDAKDVIKWAEAQETFFRAIVDTTRTDIEFEKAIRLVAEDARDKMQEFKKFARAIVPVDSSHESFLQRLKQMGNAELFQKNFRDADEAAMKAMSKLTEALSAGTFVKINKISRDVDMISRGQEEHTQKLGDVEEKIDELDVPGLHQKLDLLLRGQGIPEAGVEGDLRNVLPQGVSVDLGAFLESYDQTVLKFTDLTPHQQEKLKDVRKAKVSVLMAPAGGGKTFVAIQRMREFLEYFPTQRILFVARNNALALFVCKWLAAASRKSVEDVTELVHVLIAPFEQGRRRVHVKESGSRRRLIFDETSAEATEYSLVVVDEAHQIVHDAALRAQLTVISAAQTHLLFLVDASQATEAIPDPEELARSLVSLPGKQDVAVVTLSEVVRSTKRIVAGASAFQLEAGGKAETSWPQGREWPGPPLLGRTFRMADGEDASKRYAEEVVKAIADVRRQLACLDDLDDRVAVVGPNEAFVKDLRDPLDRALDSFAPMSATLASTSDQPPNACGTYILDHETGGSGGTAYYCAANGLYLYERSSGSWCVGKTHGDKSCKAYESPKGWSFYLNKTWTLRSDVMLTFARRFELELVNAATASAVLTRGETAARDTDDKGWLVLDSVDNMDGLERLVVICVGLDQVIDRGAGVLETRSRLYRAMTRAQLAVAVVNEVLPGGWLEFLGHVELSADDFDDAAERENRAETAADEIVDAIVTEDAIDISDIHDDGVEVAETPALANDTADAPVEEKAAVDADAATTPSEAEPMKVLTSIWDTSAVATASRGELRFMPFSESVDLSKLALVRTLEGHSKNVRCGVQCTFVMMRLRRRSFVLPCFRTGGASFLRRATTRLRCGTWRPANAWRRWKGTRVGCGARRPLYFCDDLASS
jgi:hypothetical protein